MEVFVRGGLPVPLNRELDTAITFSCFSVGVSAFFDRIVSWFLAPSSFPIATSSALSVDNVTLSSSFWISGLIIFAVNISRRSSSSRWPSWQCSATERSAEWNCSIVSPRCWRRVNNRYLSNVTFLGRMNVVSSSSQISFVVFVSTLVCGNFLPCVFLPSTPRLSILGTWLSCLPCPKAYLHTILPHGRWRYTHFSTL